MTTNTSSDRPRVSLCCEPGLYLGNSSCYADDSFAAEKIILPEIYHSNLSISSFSPEFLPQLSRIDCVDNAVYNLHSNLTENVLIYLLENGTIYVNDSINGAKSFDIDNYCLASQMTVNGPTCVASVCLKPRQIIELRPLIVNVILPILSIPFVVVIFMIHALLPEMRNIQGHIFRSYIVALFFMWITIAEINVNPHCITVIAIVLQISLLASFFWMSVMGFDIWWTFGGFASLQRKTTLKDKKKFIIYNCYAWGIPTLITGTGAILDFFPAEWTTLIRPGINIECDVTSEIANDVFFVGPATATTILNIFFFASTAVKIIRQKRATAQHLGGADSQRHDDKSKERFSLYLKLFIVMGISRLGGIIAWRYYKQLPDYIWYCLAAEGNLQGPIILIIYVWKDNTKRMLVERLETLNKRFTSSKTTSCDSLRSAEAQNGQETISLESNDSHCNHEK